MSQIFTETVTINAPLEEVWNYFINLEENAPNWMKGIQEMEKETTGEIHLNDMVGYSKCMFFKKNNRSY